jgi:hypothetical protein
MNVSPQKMVSLNNLSDAIEEIIKESSAFNHYSALDTIE